MKYGIVIAVYLAANVLANLVVYHYGQAALIFTAFVLIPFDLAARDILHDRWARTGDIKQKMAAIIVVGSLLTYWVNADAVRVAIASSVAFALAATIDTIVYQRLLHRSRSVRMNSSNVASAFTDSIAFPLIAFSALSPYITISQAVLKIAGGFLWVVLLIRLFPPENPASSNS